MKSDQSVLSGTINSPNINPDGSTLKPRTPAIKDEKQAIELVRTLKLENQTRNSKNARITAKYAAERPWRPELLEQEGLSYKSNFSTQPLANLIDRVAPRFTQAVQALKYFTNAKLPEHVNGAAQKSELFQREITSTIRSWTGWKDFLSEVCQENALFGFTCAGWVNEFSWRPTHFRQDAFFVPKGTKQNSDYAQVIVLTQKLLLHEFYDLIKDKDAAKDAGWDLKNCIEVLNDSTPDKSRSGSSDDVRAWEDLNREIGVGASFVQGTKTVQLDHLFAVETETGKVEHWVLAVDKNLKLLHREEQFDKTCEVASFFSFQFANGTLHGSKGIGRQVYAIAGIVDRGRNEVVDRLALAGKILLACDEKKIPRFRLNVRGNAVLIGSDYTVSESKIDGSVEEFLQLDEYMGRLLDDISGNVSARRMQLQGERPTAAQVNLVASREEESKDASIARFLTQFSSFVSTLQRKLCSPQVEEDDAKEMRKRLLKVMTKDELKMLAEMPSAEVIKDLSELQRQQIVLIATESKGNPLYNQRVMEEEKLTALIDADFAKRVLLPDPDPTMLAEQARLQKMEFVLMASSQQPAEVSPRDGHRIHLDLVKQALEAALPNLADTPEQLPVISAYLGHAKLHVQSGLQTEVAQGGENFSGDAAWIAIVEQQLRAIQAHEQAVAEATAQGAPPEIAAQAGLQAAQQTQTAPVPGPQGPP